MHLLATVRGDLIRIIGNLTEAAGIVFDSSDHRKTTGLADPAPVIQTFFVR